MFIEVCYINGGEGSSRRVCVVFPKNPGLRPFRKVFAQTSNPTRMDHFTQKDPIGVDQKILMVLD